MTRQEGERGRGIVRRILRNRWAFRMIGIIVFILILLRIDLREALRTLASVDPWMVLLSLFIQGIAMLVATLRWQLIMVRLAIRIPFWRTFIHQLIGTSAALVTPGQLGEFVKVLYHRDEGYPLPESFLSVVIDRAYDLLMLFFFGFISLAILFGLPPNLTLIVAGVPAVLFILGFLFYRNQERSAHFIANTLRRMTPKAYKDVVQQDSFRLAQKVGELDLRFLIVVGLLSLLNYVLLLARVYAIVLSLHLVVPIGFFVLVVPLLRLIGLVPISILGIGTRDLASIYLFGQVGVPETSALLISTLGLITLQVQAILGLLAWWRFPLGSQEEQGPVLQESVAQD